jgi:DNA-binding HxlR family transcriptional regulator
VLDALRCETVDVGGYQQQFCPVARASEIFAERWTPIIIRNLLLGCRTFNELVEGAPGIPRSLLSARLRGLEVRGVVRRTPAAKGHGPQYALTAGHELQAVCDALGTWGARWLDIAPQDLDPGVLLWAIARVFDVDRLPTYRLVVRIDLTDHPRLTFWWLLQPTGAELCRKPPGHDEDLVLRADSIWLARWHAGLTSLATARREGHIVIGGPPRLVRAFAALSRLGRFANVRPAVRDVSA